MTDNGDSREKITLSLAKAMSRFTPEQWSIYNALLLRMRHGNVSDEEASQIIEHQLGFADKGTWRDLLD